MLTGENGLLSKSLEAKIANDKAEIQDKVETEVLASIDNKGKINWTELKDNITANVKPKNGITQKDETDETKGITFIVEKNKRDYNVEVNEKGKVTVTYEGEVKGEGTTIPSEEPEEKIEISHEIQTEQVEEKEIPTPVGGEIKTDENGEKFPIPSGFTYKEGNVSDGAVVIAPDQSEFVWVPVKRAIAESEETATKENKKLTTAKIIITVKSKEEITEIINETEGNIEKISDTEYRVTENGKYKFKVTTNEGKSEEYTVDVKEIEEITEENKAMAVVDPTDGNNYRGMLYEFSEKGLKSSVMTGCTTTAFTSRFKANREPAFITGTTGTDYDANLGYNTVGLTEEGLKAEYKSMIENVDKYGGFYVGRYETSFSENKAQSKKDQRLIENCFRWYEIYDREKKYASNNGINDIVGSSMIWGSQWDAMLNWMLKGNDAKNIFTGFDLMARSHGDPGSDEMIQSSNFDGVTGFDPENVINKIYDLGGNSSEATLEANTKSSRVVRGRRD